MLGIVVGRKATAIVVGQDYRRSAVLTAADHDNVLTLTQDWSFGTYCEG